MTRTPAGNRRLAQWRVKCFYDSLVKGSSFVLLMNICAKNPPLRQAPKRYGQVLSTTLRQVQNIIV